MHNRITSIDFKAEPPKIDLPFPKSIKPILHLFLRISPVVTAAVLFASCNTKPSTIEHNNEQQTLVVREYRESEQRQRLDALLAEFGNNKQLPRNFELQALLALSHYPELKDIKIQFIVDDVGIPLSSRPHWASVLRSARNRTYLVIIDSALEGPRDVLLLKNQPFNAQIGIIGHELSHTAYYLGRSFWGILSDAFCQLSDCRINFERATDRRLIGYGLGWQRYDHAAFVRRRFSIEPDREPTSNSETVGGAYMRPAELLSIMKNNAEY